MSVKLPLRIADPPPGLVPSVVKGFCVGRDELGLFLLTCADDP